MTLATSVWVVLMLLGFVFSAVFSGVETGLYRLNRVRLQILDHQQVTAAQALRQLLADPTIALTTLLIGNNIANYLGTAALAVVLAHSGFAEWQVVLLNVLIVTPVLFVFGETLPKDLFAAHADRLTYRFWLLLVVCRRLFTITGLIPLIAGLTRMVLRTLGEKDQLAPLHPRRQVEVLVKEGVGHGLLTREQSAIIERVLEMSRRTVDQVMTPWNKTQWVRADDPAAKLVELTRTTVRRRFPVIDDRGELVGVVSADDVYYREVAPDTPIRALSQPPLTLLRQTPLRVSLDFVQKSHARIAVVLDGRQPVGVATIKDLIQPITGELAGW
jgi:putative hemolysin